VLPHSRLGEIRKFGWARAKMAGSAGGSAITRVRQRRAKTKPSSLRPRSSTTKRARPALHTALICSIARRLAAASEQSEQDELIWRLTTALHAPHLPDMDQPVADPASLVCLTTGFDHPSVDPSLVANSSSDVAAALESLETPSIASVRAARVLSTRDDDAECFTGSELVDWASAMDAPAPSAAAPPRAYESRRPAALSVNFEQRCASVTKVVAASAVSAADLLQQQKRQLHQQHQHQLSDQQPTQAPTQAPPVPETTIVVKEAAGVPVTAACISPTSTLDLP